MQVSEYRDLPLRKSRMPSAPSSFRALSAAQKAESMYVESLKSSVELAT